jgi:hypothetical protein
LHHELLKGELIYSLSNLRNGKENEAMTKQVLEGDERIKL